MSLSGSTPVVGEGVRRSRLDCLRRSKPWCSFERFAIVQSSWYRFALVPFLRSLSLPLSSRTISWRWTRRFSSSFEYVVGGVAPSCAIRHSDYLVPIIPRVCVSYFGERHGGTDLIISSVVIRRDSFLERNSNSFESSLVSYIQSSKLFQLHVKHIALLLRNTEFFVLLSDEEERRGESMTVIRHIYLCIHCREYERKSLQSHPRWLSFFSILSSSLLNNSHRI